MTESFIVESFTRRRTDFRAGSMSGPWSWQDEYRDMLRAVSVFTDLVKTARPISGYVYAHRVVRVDYAVSNEVEVIRERMILPEARPLVSLVDAAPYPVDLMLADWEMELPT